MKVEDYSGKRFGRLTVKKQFYREQSRLYCLCVCDCGAEKVIRRDSLKNGKTLSCGCLAKERHPVKHEMHGTRLYSIWCGMRARCNNSNLRVYKYYGGKGVAVCKEWDDFKNFQTWSMNNGYSENLTIDRIDFDGGYNPNNCRWVTMAKQSNNRSNTRFMTLNGETKAIKEWSDILEIPRNVLYWRTTHGWDDTKALVTPVQQQFKAKKGEIL